MFMKFSPLTVELLEFIVKSKTLTDKVRSPVPDNISIQRPKNMIKPATRGPKVFPPSIFYFQTETVRETSNEIGHEQRRFKTFP
jgi:hypothetical protein